VLTATVLVLAGAMGLAASRPRAAGSVAVCQNNLRRLMTAWLLYAEDNRGRVARNYTITATEAAVSGNTNLPWAPNTMTWDSTRSNTNQELASKSCLTPYVRLSDDNVMPFGCPSDRFVSPRQRALGWSHRLRSYSMNGFIGEYQPMVAGAGFSEQSFYSSEFRQCYRISSFPHPARCFVLVEEHPDSINDGFFINPPAIGATSYWTDLPASLHEGSQHTSFADGHVERRWWRSARSTIQPVRYNYTVPPAFDEAGRQDYAWLMEWAAVRMDGTSP
jgi:hypothetical protein